MMENFLVDNKNGRYFNPASSIVIDYALLMFIGFSLNQLVNGDLKLEKPDRPLYVIDNDNFII